MADIGRFLLFLRRYDIVMAADGGSLAILRNLPVVLLLLSRLFPDEENDDDEERGDNDRLLDFKQFYDHADLSLGNNFLTEDMKANKNSSIARLKNLRNACRNIYTDLDEFIQWGEQISDGTLAHIIDEIIENEKPTEAHKRTLRANRLMFNFAGQVSAGMGDEVRRSAESLRLIFVRYERGPYAVVGELESTDESSNDGN